MEQGIYADSRGERPGVKLEVLDSSVEYGAHPRSTAPGPATARPQTSVSPAKVSLAFLAVKRVTDILGSLCLLAFSFPWLLLIALWIRLESPGPAIYRRRVLAWQRWDPTQGTGALKTFDAYKLRTMITDADEYFKKHPHLLSAYQKDWKLLNDPRITRFGRFLRSFSIDEVPQLINVLKGEMSLIGPRIITTPELARYGEHGARLLSVKPGLTGLWQVSGRQELSYEERVLLDMTYIETRCLALDLQILLKTVKCVLLRRGAY